MRARPTLPLAISKAASPTQWQWHHQRSSLPGPSTRRQSIPPTHLGSYLAATTPDSCGSARWNVVRRLRGARPVRPIRQSRSAPATEPVAAAGAPDWERAGSGAGPGRGLAALCGWALGLKDAFRRGENPWRGEALLGGCRRRVWGLSWDRGGCPNQEHLT